MFGIIQSCRLIGLEPFHNLLNISAAVHKGRTDYQTPRPEPWVALAADQSA
jgi:hypothetical protein